MNTDLHSSRRTTRFIAIVAAACAAFAIALLGMIGAAAPAHAHDQLVGSEGEITADGQYIDWTLQFNNEPLALGNEIIAVAEDGTDLIVGEPSVSGRSITQRLAMPGFDETVTVTWRVTSSDGHPIADQFAFAVLDREGGTQLELRDVPGAESSTGEHSHDEAEHTHGDDAQDGHSHDHETDEGSTTADAEATSDESSTGMSTFSMILIGGGVVLIVLGVIGSLVALKRNKR